MAYRKTKQSDGRVTIHDVSVFAACKRGKYEYDDAWISKAVAVARSEERMGFKPPVFVKHNGDFKGEDEKAEGRMANFRKQEVRVAGKLEPGIVCDLVDLDPEVAHQIETHRLCGRSIETFAPMVRNKIDGVALLGRTAPYHALAQGSEPEKVSFSLRDPNDEESILVTQEDFMFPGAPPPAPGAPSAPPAHAPGGDPLAILKQIQALIGPLLQAPAAAPAPAAPAAAPAAPAAAPAQKMSLEDTQPVAIDAALEAEKFRLQQEALLESEAKRLAAEASEKAAKFEQDIATTMATLAAEGKVASEAYVREKVQEFGLEKFNKVLRPLLLSAPVGNRGPARPTTFSLSPQDPDLQAFAAVSPDVREVAINAAREFDLEVSRNPGFATPENTRASFIEADVRRFKNGG